MQDEIGIESSTQGQGLFPRRELGEQEGGAALDGTQYVSRLDVRR
jgi:hypothetical protein